jgi:hypothetical protein
MFRLMLVWRKCCYSGALLQSSREMKIGFLPIQSQEGRTTRRACSSRRSNGLPSSPNWERTLVGTHFATLKGFGVDSNDGCCPVAVQQRFE